MKTALCDLGAGVSVMPLSLHRRLELNKLAPTEISLQMADKSSAILLHLELALVFPEEEGMMQQSSISISLSF